MKQTFSLEIIYTHDSKVIEVSAIDIASPTGGFYIGHGSTPLTSLLGKETQLTLLLPTGSQNIITIPAGILYINSQGDVSILIVDPKLLHFIDN